MVIAFSLIIKHRAPLTTTNPISPHHSQNLIAYSLNTKQRSPRHHPQSRSPIPSTPNRDRPVTTHNPDRLLPHHQTAIASQ
jgi:hypothetical protein